MAAAEVVRTVGRLFEQPRYTQATDRDLLGRYLSEQDESAFEALARRHAKLVRASVAGVLSDPNDIDDALQATFLVLLRRAPGTKWEAGIGPWLYGVAHRVAVRLRSTALRRSAPVNEVNPHAPMESCDAGLREACDLLHTELDRLPDRYRMPLLLCYLEGQTRDEAAVALGISVGTVKGRVRRGCDLLRRRLTQRGVTLSVGLLAAVAAPQRIGAIDSIVSAILRGACSSRASLLAREMTMKSLLGKVAALVTAAVVVVGVGTGLLAGGDVTDPSGAVASASTEGLPYVSDEVEDPPATKSAGGASISTEGLRYVPPDSLAFIHVNVRAIWAGPLGTSARKAESKLLEGLVEQIKNQTGVHPNDLESATIFIPKIKISENPRMGIVLTFRAPYDKLQLTTAIMKNGMSGGQELSIVTPSDRVAVILIGLGKSFGEPQGAEENGQLTPTIQEAVAGKHLLVVGLNPSRIPDDILDKDKPELDPYRSILCANAISMTVDLGKEFAMEVRVRATSPAKAIEAEKALALLTKLLTQGLELFTKEIGMENDQVSKDSMMLINALQSAVKGAKFGSERSEARVRVSLSGDLPYGTEIARTVIKIRGAALRAQSANNLKQIAIAMLNYESTYGSFPPAAIVDKAGKPMLSWRVLILPYIEQNALYKEFKLDEPWDSEHNKKLIANMPKTYIIPEDTLAKKGETRYRVFVGKGAAFDSIKKLKISEITDGTSNTIMVAAAADGVPWTKPDELAFDPDQDPGKLMGKVDGRVYQVAFFDGSIRAFEKPPEAKILKALITRAGGEVIGKPGKPE